jgi:hypothetical protein
MAEFTTADDGLDPTGWYPGKKHGFVKNLGRVASMGIYSPDNRLATRLNVQRLETRGQNKESIKHMRELHQLALDSLRDYYAKAHPEWDPEKVSQMSASVFASRALADTEENNARGANASVDIEKAKGLLPGAAAGATEGQDAARASARASAARNRNVEANERGRAQYEEDAGARDILTQMDSSRAQSAEAGARNVEAGNRERKATAARTFQTPFKSAQYDDISIDADMQKVKDEQAAADWKRVVDSQVRPITGSTMVEDAMRQADEIGNARKRAQSMGRMLSNPTTADSITASELNRHSLTVPYGGTVVPVVPVDQSTAIQGETRHPDVVEYGQKIDPTTGKIIPVIQRKVYGPQGTNQPPSTADFDGLNGKRAPIRVDPAVINSLIGGR